METTRPKVVLVKLVPQGNARVYARWDPDLYSPRGTADVQVEVSPDTWRPQHWALLEGIKDGRLWLCSSTGVMAPTKGVPTMKAGSSHIPKRLMAPPEPAKPKPKVLPAPKPSDSFMARNGR